MTRLKLNSNETRWLLKAIQTQLKADRAFLRTYETRDLERHYKTATALTIAYRNEVGLGEAINARLKELTDNPTLPRKRKAL